MPFFFFCTAEFLAPAKHKSTAKITTEKQGNNNYVTVHAKIKHKSAKIFFELAMDYENTMPDEPS